MRSTKISSRLLSMPRPVSRPTGLFADVLGVVFRFACCPHQWEQKGESGGEQLWRFWERKRERERREEKGSEGKGYDNTGLRLKEQYKDSGRKEE
jgi:hypothetical protein